MPNLTYIPVTKHTAKEYLPGTLTGGTIHAFTDGSCYPNPGPGGWGVVIISGEEEYRFGGFKRQTTNNEMELMAIYKTMLILKKTVKPIRIISDSQYSLHAIGKHCVKWQKAGGYTGSGKRAANFSLIKKINLLCSTKDVTLHHMRGHRGHHYNEIADTICGEERKKLIAAMNL